MAIVTPASGIVHDVHDLLDGNSLKNIHAKTINIHAIANNLILTGFVIQKTIRFTGFRKANTSHIDFDYLYYEVH
jgi:hypothetical protein